MSSTAARDSAPLASERAVHVKVCGVRDADNALACAALGARAIGLNFVDASPRKVDVATARSISRAIGDRALVVGVIANLSVDAMKRLKDEAELGCLQLHGDESPADLEEMLPHAYKAIRIATADDVARARSFPGEHLLVDAKVEGALGGTGHSFDWALVRGLARERKLTLAGGITPANAARAVREVAPYCIDVASGVEDAGAPGVKNLAKVEALIAAVRAAARY